MSNSYRDFNQNLINDLRANGGKASSGPFKGGDVLILTTKGAKSGETREHPLAFSRDNGHYVIVASKGGAPTNPFKARAKVIDSDDYERLYQQHAQKMPGFHEYRQKTTRKIPVIVLERAGSDHTA